MKKRILMICMCFTLVFAVISKDVHETKAFAPALPALAIGAIALGSGIYFYNKEDLQSFASDCLSWLEDQVPDAFHDLANLVANGDKILISSIACKGVMFYLKSKGWGEKTLSSIQVNSSVSALFSMFYAQISSFDISFEYQQKFEAFANLLSTGDYNLVCQYFDWGGNDSWYSFILLEKDITDIFAPSYMDSPFSDLYGVRANGEILNVNSSHIGNVTRFLRFGVYEENNSKVSSIAPIQGSAGLGYLIDNLLSNSDTFDTTFSNTFFPSGIRVWRDEARFKNGNEKDILHITGTNYVSVPIDVGYATDLQEEDTAIAVPTVGEMTIDEFIDSTKDLAIDDIPAWIDVIDKIIATDTDVDVPTDTPSEDTKPSVPPLVSDFTADLTSLFPFCLPFDLIDLVKALSVEPVAPKWEIPIKFKYGTVVDYKQTFVLDMKDYESVVKIFRTLETIGFIVGLIMITRNQMIKG